MPWISVVVPNFNRVGTIKSAIDSILSQDYPNVECIVVDAASTDGTLEVLKSYGDRITWISRPDSGAFDAINDGWKKSRGEILAWVNSDDIWEEGAAQFAADYFVNHPDIDVLYGTCGAIDRNGRLIEQYPPRPWDLEFALVNCDHIINQTASFIRRNVIEKVGFLYPAWCHDHDLWLRIAASGGTFGTTPRRLGSARIWPDNLGNNPSVIINGKVGLTKRFFEAPNLPRHIKKLKGRAISNSYLRSLFYIRPKPQNWRIGAKILLHAFLADPFNGFYLLNQVGSVLLQRTPVPGVIKTAKNVVRSACHRLGSIVYGPKVRPVAAAALHIPLGSVLRFLAPVAAIAAGVAFSYQSDLGGEEAARTFAFVSTPLLVMVALYDWRRRAD